MLECTYECSMSACDVHVITVCVRYAQKKSNGQMVGLAHKAPGGGTDMYERLRMPPLHDMEGSALG